MRTFNVPHRIVLPGIAISVNNSKFSTNVFLFGIIDHNSLLNNSNSLIGLSSIFIKKLGHCRYLSAPSQTGVTSK